MNRKETTATKQREFNETKWADSEFSQNYRDEANIYLPFRQQFFAVTKSLYAHCIATDSQARIMDLGCGDGLFIQELLQSFSPAMVTMVDGSDEMLAAAQTRLADKADINFVHSTFQELLADEPLKGNFDFIYSSLAIHHLPFTEKKQLYAYIHKLLSPNGCFINYDVVSPPSDNMEKYHLALWREWILAQSDKEMMAKVLAIPDQYKRNPDNIPDTLESQLHALTAIGFKDVDCHFKYGIFSLFAGRK